MKVWEALVPRPSIRLPRASLAILLALTLHTTGCSWAFLTPAPKLPISPTPPVHCSRGKALPIVDTVISVASGVDGAALLVLAAATPATCTYSYYGYSCAEPNRALMYGIGAASLAAAAMTAFSAAYGYSEVGRCREVTNLQTACVSGQEDSCRRLFVLPPGDPLPASLRPTLPSVESSPAPAPPTR